MFYSWLFLLEKASGGWGPVIDLSPVNVYVLQTKFLMGTVVLVLISIWKGDIMISVVLKDAYF